MEGEISNYRKQGSGHQYFTLKDHGSQLSCVLFARPGLWRKAGPPLTDGMCVRVQGNLTVYEARGQYQMNVQAVQPAGAGLLQAKFEALKRRLEAEGLFAPERKQPLPPFPVRVAIVTSPTGAALRDMLNILTRRSPWVQVLISPVRVQGEGAGREIAAAVTELNHLEEAGLPAPDLIVVTRGGGSTEDLWEFNDEDLARAIAASAIPVISAVGHEIDFSISDFVADLRAPTPSAAAELAAPDRAELLRRLEERAVRLGRCAAAGVRHRRQELAALLRGGLEREPRLRLDEAAQRTDLVAEALQRAAREQFLRLQRRCAEARHILRQHRPDHLVALRRERLLRLVPRLAEAARQARGKRATRLERAQLLIVLLSPVATVQRGYALIFTPEGALIRSVTQMPPGTAVRIRVADGSASALTADPLETRGEKSATGLPVALR